MMEVSAVLFYKIIYTLTAYEEDYFFTLPPDASYQERLDFEVHLMRGLPTWEPNPDARQHYQRLAAQATAAATEQQPRLGS